MIQNYLKNVTFMYLLFIIATYSRTHFNVLLQLKYFSFVIVLEQVHFCCVVNHLSAVNYLCDSNAIIYILMTFNKISQFLEQ